MRNGQTDGQYSRGWKNL